MRTASWVRQPAVVALLVLLSAPTTDARESHAFFAGRIWTGQGAPVENGVLVVVDGKITAVGPRDSTVIPVDAIRHEFGSGVLIPGLVVAQSNLADGSADVDRSLTPQLKAIDGFDFQTNRDSLLAGGVTTVQLSPGNNRLMPGIGAVVKLGEAEKQARILTSEESLRVVLSSASRNPPTIYEPPVGPVSVDRPLLPTRPQLSKTLAGSVSGLRAVFRAARATERFVGTGAELSDAITSHLERGGSVRITATTAPEIRAAVDLANEFGLRLVLVDPLALEHFSGSFQTWSRRMHGVVLKGLVPGQINNPSEIQSESPAPWESAKELFEAGIAVAVRPDRDADIRDLLFVAGQFRQDGLSVEQALSTITSGAARIIGVDDRVGSLAEGCDADFVVLTSDPFSLHSHVSATYIDGKPVYKRVSTGATTVIRAGRVYTGQGNVLNGASVVVKGNSVRGIGQDVSAPVDARVYDFPDAVVVPGFVDLGTGLGLGGPLSGNVSLQTKLGEQIYAEDPAIALARRGGVTTVLLGALDSNQPTPLVAFKLGDDARVVGDPVAVRFEVSGNLSSSVPSMRQTLQRGKDYHQSWVDYEVALAAYEARHPPGKEEAKKEEEEAESADEAAEKDDAEGDATDGSARGRRGRGGDRGEAGTGNRGRRSRGGAGEGQEDQPKEGDQEEVKKEPEEESKEGQEPEGEKPPTKPRSNPALEPYRALFSGEIPAFVEARRADAISAALKLFREEFDLRTVLIGVDDVARLPDLLDGYEVSVCAGPNLMVNLDRERTNIPQLLANERIPFGFQSKGTSGSGQLPRAVQFAVSLGLGPNDALNGLTSNAATMLSNDVNFGSLSVGKDADLVVLDGPPLDMATRVLAVMVDGKWVYEQEDQR